MVSHDSRHHDFKNRILASLPEDEIAALRPHLHRITLDHYHSMAEDGQTITDAYFLEDGIASMVVTTHDGKTVETGIVGRCGMIGIPILLGTRNIPGRTFTQVPGWGFRISGEIVYREFERSREFRRRLFRYLQAQLVQTTQTAACNRLHEVEQRMARWLLLCHDRVDTDDLLLTQEFIGQMVGAPRTTVTLAIGTFQRARLIESVRNHIVILNRRGLEEAACECYGVISAEYARLSVLVPDRQLAASQVIEMRTQDPGKTGT